MTNVIRYKVGEGALVTNSDWYGSTIRALGRPAAGDLLNACLNVSAVTGRFELVEFENPKSKGPHQVIALEIENGDFDDAREVEGTKWKRGLIIKTTGIGIKGVFTAIGRRAAVDMVTSVTNMAKPGDKFNLWWHYHEIDGKQLKLYILEVLND